MIKKIDGKYHVYSEKGKPFGTYNSLAQAKKRLGQMEYFKHQKTANLFSVESLLPAAPSMLIGPGTLNKALESRISSGQGLIGAEKELAERVGKPKTKQDHKAARIMTHPATLGGATFGIGMTAPNVVAYNRRKALTAAKAKAMEGIANYKARKISKQTLTKGIEQLDRFLNLKIYGGEPISVLKPLKSELKKIPMHSAKSLLPAAAFSAALTTAYVPWKRHQYAKRLMQSEREGLNSFVRSKLRESFEKEAGIPFAIIDDAAILAARAIQMAEAEKKTKALSEQKVKKELNQIEQKGI